MRNVSNRGELIIFIVCLGVVSFGCGFFAVEVYDEIYEETRQRQELLKSLNARLEDGHRLLGEMRRELREIGQIYPEGLADSLGDANKRLDQTNRELEEARTATDQAGKYYLCLQACTSRPDAFSQLIREYQKWTSEQAGSEIKTDEEVAHSDETFMQKHLLWAQARVQDAQTRIENAPTRLKELTHVQDARARLKQLIRELDEARHAQEQAMRYHFWLQRFMELGAFHQLIREYEEWTSEQAGSEGKTDGEVAQSNEAFLQEHLYKAKIRVENGQARLEELAKVQRQEVGLSDVRAKHDRLASQCEDLEKYCGEIEKRIAELKNAR